MRQRDFATGARVVRAYSRACKAMQKEGVALLKTTESAGFIGADGGPAEYQVFVTVVRYDVKLLKEKPETEGLLCPV